MKVDLSGICDRYDLKVRLLLPFEDLILISCETQSQKISMAICEGCALLTPHKRMLGGGIEAILLNATGEDYIAIAERIAMAAEEAGYSVKRERQDLFAAPKSVQSFVLS